MVLTAQPIRLYDMTTKAGPHHPVCLNVWKTRINLNYLGLPFETTWVSMDQIENQAKVLGVPPTGTKPTGGDMYTLPIIYDPRTAEHVVDTYRIARHLEQTYGVPKMTGRSLFPWATEEDDAWIMDHNLRVIRAILYPLLVLGVTACLSNGGAAYMRSSRLDWYGKVLEELGTPKERRAEEWAKLRAYLNESHVCERAQRIGEGLTFRDMVLGGMFKWIQVAGEPGELEKILTWEDGRWKEFFAVIEKYSHSPII